MPAPLDHEVRAAIEQAIRDGHTRNQIARDHDVSGSTVSKIAKTLETNGAAPAFDRSQTKNAREALAVDNAAERERLRGLLLSDAHRLREQLWSKTEMHHFGGKDNTHNSIVLPQPTFEQQRQIMTAVGIAVDKIVRLDDGDSAEAEAASLIKSLVSDIRDRNAQKAEATPDAAG